MPTAVQHTPDDARDDESALRPDRRPVRRRSLLTGLGAGPALALLAGCSTESGGGGGEVPQVDYEQGSSPLSVELGPEIEGVPYPEGYIGPKARETEPFGDGSTEFTVLARSEAGLDLATNAHSLHLEETTGVRITYQTVPQGDEGSPKVNAIISSGDLPDAMMLGPEWMGGLTKSQLYAYGTQGLFQPLDKLIDEVAPQLQELFEQNPDLRASWTAPDGAMYGIPAVNQCYHCASSASRTFVHQPSLEAAGWSEQPATLDEFEQMLRDMKSAKPDILPLSGDKDNLPFALISAPFLDLGIDRLRKDGDTIVYTPSDEKFREALAVAARLVRDGLLDPNTFTRDNEQFKRLTMDPAGTRVGVSQMPHHHSLLDVDYYDPKSLWNEYVALEPFSGPDGDPVIPWNETHGDAVGLVITSSCSDPETMVRWADHQLGLLPTLEFSYGRQGEQWDWAGPDVVGIDSRAAIYAAIPQKDGSPENTTWPEFHPHNSSMDVRNGLGVDEKTSIEPALYRAGKLYEAYRNSLESLFAPPFFSADQAAEIGELRTNLDGLFAQNATKMCLGDLDPTDDADWESYLSAFDAAGLDRYLEVLTEADSERA